MAGMFYNGWVSDLLGRVTAAAADWQLKIFQATDSLSFYFYFLGIALTIRFLIIPLVGNSMRGSSDKAKKSSKDKGGKE